MPHSMKANGVLQISSFDDSKFIFGWTVPLSSVFHTIVSGSVSMLSDDRSCHICHFSVGQSECCSAPKLFDGTCDAAPWQEVTRGCMDTAGSLSSGLAGDAITSSDWWNAVRRLDAIGCIWWRGSLRGLPSALVTCRHALHSVAIIVWDVCVSCIGSVSLSSS